MRTAVGILVALASVSGVLAKETDCRIKPGISDELAQRGMCGFDSASRSFAGSSTEQASCLTTTVKQGGALGPAHFPSSLRDLVGQPVRISAAQAKAYLVKQGIAETDVGGSLEKKVTAGYLIIHDTSSPNCSAPQSKCDKTLGVFPPHMNDAGWSANSTFNGYKSRVGQPVANLMTNRTGDSLSMANLDDVVRTTKFEVCRARSLTSGAFVGIENVQPRVGAPAIPSPGKKANDLIAPIPGFTEAQLQRLGLIYVIASVRHGTWLVPAYHAVLDHYFLDAHDDPQHFDIDAFAAAVQSIVATMTQTAENSEVRTREIALVASPKGTAPTCTERWIKATGIKTQKAAKAFGRSCLIADGAKEVHLSKSELDAQLLVAVPVGGALAELQPTDIASFCKGYKRTTPEQRAEFWRILFTALIERESSNDTVALLWENRQNEYSIGLTQVSYSNNHAYSCGFLREIDLTDPAQNLACGVKVMTKLVTQSGGIGNHGGKPISAATFWSTLQVSPGQHEASGGGPPLDSRSYIESKTRALPFCG